MGRRAPVRESSPKKAALVDLNLKALELGRDYAG